MKLISIKKLAETLNQKAISDDHNISIFPELRKKYLKKNIYQMKYLDY
jgi:hypothetical protein